MSLLFTKNMISGLSGMDLVLADAEKLKGYVDNALFWLMAWRIPLQPFYDPHMVASYYNRRPHVLLFRIIQVRNVNIHFELFVCFFTFYISSTRYGLHFYGKFSLFIKSGPTYILRALVTEILTQLDFWRPVSTI